MNNLDKQRPDGWRDASLFSFVEQSWSNALATFQAMPDQIRRVELIDSMFTETGYPRAPGSACRGARLR